MKKVYTILAVLALAMLVGTSAFSQAITIENASFDDDFTFDADTLDGWTFDNVEGNTVKFTDADYTDGNGAMELVVDELGADPWSIQLSYSNQDEWMCEVNDHYLLTIDFKDLTNHSSDTMTVNFTCGEHTDWAEMNRYEGLPLEEEWQTVSMYMTTNWTSEVDGANGNYRPYMSNHFTSLGSCLFDNFTITQVQTMGAYASADSIVIRLFSFLDETSLNADDFVVTVEGTEVASTSIGVRDDLESIFLILESAPGEDDEIVITYTAGTLSYVASVTDEIDSFVEIINEKTVGINRNIYTKANGLVYPTLATEVINLKSSINIEKVSIYDVTGQQVLVVEGNQKQIDVSELVNGVYFVQVLATDNSMYTNQFIKQ